LIQGRNVVKRYGCNQCHTVEGMAGLLWQYKADLGVDPATLPPNLFGQGYRTRSEWLVKFLKNPIWLRPIVNVHMPRFGMSDDEARALATYFVRLAGEDASILMPQEDSPLAGHRFESPLTLEATATRPAVGPLTSWVDEARALFDTINCNKCHLPKGSPGADPQDGGVAPSFSLAAERLRTSWVEALLYNPAHLINGTKMPQFFPMQRKYGRDVNA
ncbi:MAG: c-type cytochrome, partial [Planctomycetes bacterium]|nr:c-type cytochrome [Planctomycetota bacterium]